MYNLRKETSSNHDGKGAKVKMGKVTKESKTKQKPKKKTGRFVNEKETFSG